MTSQSSLLWLLVPLAIGFAALAALLLVGKVPLGYNIRNLIVRWKTTLLTALAFTLVICLLTIMMAFVRGMQRITDESGEPANVIVLSDGATDEIFSNLAITDVSKVEYQDGVEKDAQKRPLVSKELFVIVNQPIANPTAGGPRRRFMQLRGIFDTEIARQVHGLEFVAGGMFSAAGAQGPDAAYEAVLGEGVARNLGVGVGDRFEVGPRQWIVVGIMKSFGSTFGSEIWAKGDLVGKTFGKENNYTSMVIRTRDAEAARELAIRLKSYEEAALMAMTETEYYARLGETNLQFLYAIMVMAIIMGMGGVCGVMNTMFAAISQRTREIGVLRVLGFRSWQVLVSFLLESMCIALVGGILGCALGYLADGWTATHNVSGGQGSGKTVTFKLVVDASTLLLGMLFTLGMGIVGGLFPALTAMRMKPLDALR